MEKNNFRLGTQVWSKLILDGLLVLDVWINPTDGNIRSTRAMMGELYYII